MFYKDRLDISYIIIWDEKGFTRRYKNLKKKLQGESIDELAIKIKSY